MGDKKTAFDNLLAGTEQNPEGGVAERRSAVQQSGDGRRGTGLGPAWPRLPCALPAGTRRASPRPRRAPACRSRPPLGRWQQLLQGDWLRRASVMRAGRAGRGYLAPRPVPARPRRGCAGGPRLAGPGTQRGGAAPQRGGEAGPGPAPLLHAWGREEEPPAPRGGG